MSSIRQWPLLLAVALAAGPGEAAPKQPHTPTLVQVELDDAQLNRLKLNHHLPFATREPGGLEITTAAGADWLTLGFAVGDQVIAENGRPIGERLRIGEGTSVFEVLRSRKLVLLRIVVHPSPFKGHTIDEDNYENLLERAANAPNDPQSTPVHGADNKPSGVRVIDGLLGIYLHCEVGDLIRSIDGVPIRSDAELATAIQNLRIGNTEMELERGGRMVTVKLIRKAPLDFTQLKRLSATRFEITQAFATAIAADHDILTKKLSTSPRIVNGKPNGFTVYDLKPDAPAARLGIVDGDIVVDFGGYPIDTFSNVIDAWRALEHASRLEVHVLRKGKPVTLTYVVR